MLNVYVGRRLETKEQAQLCENLHCAFLKLDLGANLGRLCPVKGTQNCVALGIGGIIPCIEFLNPHP